MIAHVFEVGQVVLYRQILPVVYRQILPLVSLGVWAGQSMFQSCVIVFYRQILPVGLCVGPVSLLRYCWYGRIVCSETMFTPVRLPRFDGVFAGHRVF